MFVLSVVTDSHLTGLLVGVFQFFLFSNLVCEKEESKISPHFKVVFNKFNVVLFKLQYECKSLGDLAKMLTLAQEVWVEPAPTSAAQKGPH